MTVAINDQFLWEIFIGHHYAALDLFFKDLKISANFLSVQSNVEYDKTWEYIGYVNSLKDELVEVKNIYSTEKVNSKRYNLQFTDVWLVNNLSSVNPAISSTALEVAKVRNLNDITLFADLFLEAYSLETDLYGKLNPSYKSCIINNFLSKTSKVRFYYVLHKGIPCATFALSFVADICYFYCLGVLPQYRGLGISHYVHQYQNIEAVKNKCRLSVSQTISSSHVEKIAMKNGFVPVGQLSFYRHFC